MALKPSAVPGMITSLSPFIWADRLLGHSTLIHVRKSRVSVTPVTKIGVLFWSLSYGDDLGRSAASWHAAQRPGHVFKRYAPDGCLGRGSRFGSVRTIVFGLGLPTWLLSVGATTVAYAGLTSVA